MRFVLSALMWMLTTAAVALALPVMWLQHNVVDADGYAALAQRAASDPALQQAVAGELASQIGNLASTEVPTAVVGALASSYTAGSAFPGQFAQANRLAHRWMFTNSVQSQLDSQGRWVVDLAPMLADSSFQQTLSSYRIQVPQTLPVPLTENVPAAVRPGQLQRVATWGPWVSVGLAALAGVGALLTIAAARRRGKAIAALGVSLLLVGAAGWIGLELGRRYLDDMLGSVSGNPRQIAESFAEQAISSMHQWLNLALLGGGGLVLLGVIFTLLGSLGRRTVREPV